MKQLGLLTKPGSGGTMLSELAQAY